MPWWEGPEPECCRGGSGGAGQVCIGLELAHRNLQEHRRRTGLQRSRIGSAGGGGLRGFKGAKKAGRREQDRRPERSGGGAEWAGVPRGSKGRGRAGTGPNQIIIQDSTGPREAGKR